MEAWRLYKTNKTTEIVRADDMAISQEGIVSFFVNGICTLVYSHFSWTKIKHLGKDDKENELNDSPTNKA